MNKTFFSGVMISCTGAIMLFMYFVCNSLLKELSGVVEFLYLKPSMASIAFIVFMAGVTLLAFSSEGSNLKSSKVTTEEIEKD